MPFDNAGKEIMLDAIAGEITAIGLHAGSPGTGADNEVTGGGYSRGTPTFSAASGASMTLAAALPFVGPALQGVTHATFWAGATRVGSGALTGDLAFNAAGELNLAAGTNLGIENP